MGVRRLKALLVGLPLVDPGPGGQGKRAQLLFVHDVLLQHDNEGGALGVDAVHADLAAHQLHQLLDDAQPQAGALDVAVLLLIYPPESVEDIGDVLLLHPLPRVLHRIPDPHPVYRPALTPDGEGDGALTGVLDRVAQQVDEDLLDAHLVPAEHAGDGGVHVELELQALLLGLDPYHVDDLREEGPGLIGDVDALHLSGLDLGDVQDVVDEGQQQLAGPLDIPGVLRHLLGDVLPQDDLVEADDGVDRGADLVAHAGEEVVLRPVQLLDLLLLLLGEGVLLLIHPVEEHEQHAGQQPDHNHGEGGVKEGAGKGVLHHDVGVVVGDAVAEHGLRYAQAEKYVSAPPQQGDADIDEAQDKPLRHAAVKPAGGEKGDRKQGQQQHRDGRGPGLNTLSADAELDNQGHRREAQNQQSDIQGAFAHRQRKDHRDHADAGYNAEHPLPQADPVIGNYLKPFFYHVVSHLIQYAIRSPTGRRCGRRGQHTRPSAGRPHRPAFPPAPAPWPGRRAAPPRWSGTCS